MEQGMEPKKKNDKKTTLFVIGGLVILLSATAFFVFRTPKSQTYRETRVVSMDSTPTPTAAPEPIVVEETEEFVEPVKVADTAYMTVTVPGFSTDDLKKKKAEDNDKKKTKKTTTTTTKTTTTYSKTKATGQPSIVDHYYVDKNGNPVDNPNDESNTVYKIEYDKTKPLSQDQTSDMISDYLKGDTTYVEDNAKAAEAAANTSNANNTNNTSITDDTLVVMGAQGGGVTTNNNSNNTNNTNNTNKTSAGGSDDMIVLQGEAVPTDNLGSVEVGPGEEEKEEEEPEEEKEDVIMELVGDGVTSEERPSTVRVVEDGFVIDPATQEWGEYGIQTDWELPDNDGHDGTIIVGLYGLGAEYVKSIDFQCAILAGTGTIQNTDDDFVKLVHVDDGSAIQLVVTATYVDDSTKTSQIITVAHKDYSPLNSNQVMVEE